MSICIFLHNNIYHYTTDVPDQIIRLNNGPQNKNYRHVYPFIIIREILSLNISTFNGYGCNEIV